MNSPIGILLFKLCDLFRCVCSQSLRSRSNRLFAVVNRSYLKDRSYRAKGSFTAHELNTELQLASGSLRHQEVLIFEHPFNGKWFRNTDELINLDEY